MAPQGSIERRVGKRGMTFRVRYWVDGPDGKPVKRSMAFSEKAHGGRKPAEQAANLFLAKVLTSTADGTYVDPSKLTFGGLVDLWLANREAALAPSTMYTYRSILKRLADETAAIPLQRLKPLHLETLYARLRSEEVGSGAIGLLHNILSAALNQAVRWEILVRNPARSISRPEHRGRPIIYWSPEQASSFLAAEGSSDFGIIWRVALLTGMRRGELLALRWNDIDLKRNTVSIGRTVTRDNRGSPVMGDRTKTPNGVRVIPLAPSLVEPLREHRVRQRERQLAAPQWSSEDGDLVFTNDSGGMLQPQLVSRAFATAVARTELPKLTLHGTRHTFATALLVDGVHPKIAADLLGDRVEIVLRTYSHVVGLPRESAISGLDRRLAGSEVVYDINTTK